MPIDYSETADGWIALEAHRKYNLLPDGVDSPAMLREEFFSNVADDLEFRRNDDAQDPIAAFNYHTSGWPRMPRALLAAYEAEYSESADDDYLSDCRDYANEFGVEYYSDDVDVQWQWDTENRELQSHQHVISAILQAEDADVSMAEEITNYNNFLSNLESTGTALDAVRLSRFDDIIPAGLLSSLRNPNEWETLDPTDIEVRGCSACGSEAYHVEQEPGGETWLNQQGMEMDASIGDDAGIFNLHTRSHSDFICGSCYDNASTGNRFFYTTEDGIIGLRVAWPVAIDLSDEYSVLDTIEQPPSVLSSLIESQSTPGNTAPEEYQAVNIYSHPDISGSRDVETPPESLVERLLNNPGELPRQQGVVVDEHEYLILVDGSDYEAVKATKQFMEAELLA